MGNLSFFVREFDRNTSGIVWEKVRGAIFGTGGVVIQINAEPENLILLGCNYFDKTYINF